MNRKKKNKSGAKILFLLLVFFGILGAALGTALIRKNAGKEAYAFLEAASLPVVSLQYLDGYEAVLHGYTREMSVKDMRDEIVPLFADRKMSVSVDPCGTPVTEMRYEIRGLSDEKLIDSRTLGGTREAFFTEELVFSSLLEAGSEYHLILTVSAGGREVHYYTRLLYAKTQYAGELLAFVDELSASEYDRDKAETFLVSYMNPDPDSSTDDYSYADLRSKYSVLTFGNLTVTRDQDISYRITELEPTQLSVTLSYQITIDTGEEKRKYEASEFFCVRYRSGKVYILDFYRTLQEVFDTGRALREKGRVLLGAGTGENQILTSEKGSYTIFIVNRELWSYRSETNSLNRIFSFADTGDSTCRSSLDRHDMQLVRVSEEGDIDFMLYGYMNRGEYEGEVGICFYRYTAADNAIRCLFYMPVSQSEQVLMMDLGTLAYVNTQDVCYLRYGDGIFSIDMNSGESVEVSICAYPGMYAMNDRGNVVVWQEGEELDYPERLVILNMDTQSTMVVSAPEGEYIKILDFIGDDVVYGFGSRENSEIQANMDIRRLMSRLVIASAGEELIERETYEEDGVYILDAEVKDTRVVISRADRTSFGRVRVLDSRVLLLTQSDGEETAKSTILSRVNDLTKKEYYIQIGTLVGSDPGVSSPVPRFEISREVNRVNFTHQQSDVYYVYGQGRLLAVESEINRAISEAYEVMGVVVDENLNYLWTRGTRDLIKKIAIREFAVSEGEDSLAVSLRILCAQEGIQLYSVSDDLEDGKSPLAIINAAIGEDRAVSLYGCTLQEVLYFVNKGRPVMAILGDRKAAVISGYDTAGVTIWFPDPGNSETLDNTTAEEFFSGNGNAFISYRD